MKFINKYYCYLHANKSLILKPPVVVETDPDYFNSPYVVFHWKLNTKLDVDLMKQEAVAKGATQVEADRVEAELKQFAPYVLV